MGVCTRVVNFRMLEGKNSGMVKIKDMEVLEFHEYDSFEIPSPNGSDYVMFLSSIINNTTVEVAKKAIITMLNKKLGEVIKNNGCLQDQVQLRNAILTIEKYI